MSSPFQRLVLNSSSVHRLIASSPDEREEAMLSALSLHHKTKHISEDEIQKTAYTRWKNENPELHDRLVGLDAKVESIREKDPKLIPVGVERSIYMQIGIVQELQALKFFEESLLSNEKTKGYAVVSDQTRREVEVGNTITLIGKIDGLLVKNQGEKRTIVGIVEVKTRLKGFRDNPADKTQLTMYSRMMSKPSALLYVLLEYDPFVKELKKTTYKYEELRAHWEEVIFPGLTKLYPEMCELWKTRTDSLHERYIGISYKNAISKLIDQFLSILKIPAMDGDLAFIGLLEEAKDYVASEIQTCYTAFCSKITPEVVVRIRGRDIAFFEENLLSLLNFDPKDSKISYVKTYSKYVADIVKGNLTQKTLDGLWLLIEDVIRTV